MFLLVDPDKVTLVALALGALLAFAAMRITKSKITTPVQEGSRLLQAVGWAVILPQMLAALGGIFAKSGVGQVVSDLVGQVLPTEYPFVAVMAYCLGMMLFTVVMGNAFAAFAVITGGIGLPLIVQMHGGIQRLWQRSVCLLDIAERYLHQWQQTLISFLRCY